MDLLFAISELSPVLAFGGRPPVARLLDSHGRRCGVCDRKRQDLHTNLHVLEVDKACGGISIDMWAGQSTSCQFLEKKVRQTNDVISRFAKSEGLWSLTRQHVTLYPTAIAMSDDQDNDSQLGFDATDHQVRALQLYPRNLLILPW